MCCCASPPDKAASKSQPSASPSSSSLVSPPAAASATPTNQSDPIPPGQHHASALTKWPSPMLKLPRTPLRMTGEGLEVTGGPEWLRQVVLHEDVDADAL